MVGTPWQRTGLVAVKARTLEKLAEGARKAERRTLRAANGGG